MGGVFFSVTLSVTLLAILFCLLKGKLANRYGFKVIYIISLLMAIRLIIPYSIQLPYIPIFRITIPKIIPIIWITGTIISLAAELLKYRYTKRKILNNALPVVDETLIAQYEHTKDSLFIDTKIPLVMSEAVSTPMLLGIFKPLIILPVQNFTDNEAKMIFRHELIHFRRKDALKKLFFTFVAAIQWFNPFVRLLMREFCHSIECLCDEAVTNNTDNQYKKEYCYMLLQTGIHSNTIATANYFSTKEMLKMRIDSVFKKNRKSGGLLITASAICLAFSSSFLCSCTVETPDDVKGEMSRIEQGIENESSATESAEKGGLMPVSEVTANAEKELAEIAEMDGIFKFDNALIMIPQTDKIEIYERNEFYGIETPEKTYEQLRILEKEWLGGNYYADEDYTAVIMSGDTREDITIEEYLKDNRIAYIYLSCADKKYGEIELLGSGLRLWSTPLLKEKLYNNNDYNSKKYEQKIECLNANEQTLSQEFTLSDGTVTLAEAIKFAEDYMNNFQYTVDDKITYRVQDVYEYKCADGTSALDFDVRMLYNDIPNLDYSHNKYDPKPFGCERIYGMGITELKMLRKNGFEFILTTGSNTKLIPTDKTVTEMISVTDAIQLLKNKLSDDVVYDVQEVMLGYVNLSYDAQKSDGTSSYVTFPVWRINLLSGATYIQAIIDVQTGELLISK